MDQEQDDVARRRAAAEECHDQHDVMRLLAKSGKWHKARCLQQAAAHVAELSEDGAAEHEWLDLVIIALLGYMAVTGTDDIPEETMDQRLLKFKSKLELKFPDPLPGDPE